MAVTIDDLLQTPFSNRSREEKIQILNQEKPTHCFTGITCNDKGKVVLMTVFDEDTYKRIPWLTYCIKRERFFCWSCLLFVSTKTPWNSSGIANFPNILAEIIKHERTVSHLQGMLDLHMFKNKNTISNVEDSIPDQESVKKKREIAKRIIDAICHQIFQKYPPREGRFDVNKLRDTDCIANLNLLREYDISNIEYIDEAIRVLQNNRKVINDMVTVISAMAKIAIIPEIKLSTFVSIILSGHTKLHNNILYSTVLRYIKDGKVVERFVGYTKLDRRIIHKEIDQHLRKIVFEFNIADKCIGYSLDGSVIWSSRKQIRNFSLQQHISAPYAIIVPCYYHNLYDVLRQICCSIDYCDSFFRNMDAIRKFVSEKYDKLNLNFCVFVDQENVASCQWYQFIEITRNFRKQFIKGFDKIIENFEHWSVDDFHRATSFRIFLRDIKAVFLLELFTQMLELLSKVNKSLQSHKLEFLSCSLLIDDLKKSLRDKKTQGFSAIYSRSLEVSDSKQLESNSTNDSMKIMIGKCRLIFHKIMDCVISEMEIRFEHVRKFEIFRILHFKKNEDIIWNFNSLFKVAELPNKFFDSKQMLNEIQILSAKRCIFTGKTVNELYEFLTEANLKDSLENIVRLAEFILTLPCKPPFLNEKSSKYEDISVWAYLPKVFSGDCSILCVENNLLKFLKSNPSFYDEVILRVKKFQGYLS